MNRKPRIVEKRRIQRVHEDVEILVRHFESIDKSFRKSIDMYVEQGLAIQDLLEIYKMLIVFNEKDKEDNQ